MDLGLKGRNVKGLTTTLCGEDGVGFGGFGGSCLRVGLRCCGLECYMSSKQQCQQASRGHRHWRYEDFKGVIPRLEK